MGSARRGRRVLAVVGRDITGNTYLVDLAVLSEVVPGEVRFDQQCGEVIDCLKRNGLQTVVIESNFIKTLGQELKRVARERKKQIRVERVSRSWRHQKENFIADNIEPLLKTCRLWVYQPIWDRSPLRGEFQGFPRARHDDCLDRIAGAIDQLRQNRQRAGTEGLRDRPFRRDVEPIQINQPRFQPLTDK